MDARTAQSLLSFAEGTGPGLRGPDAKAAFEQLDQQYDDLQLAMQWFIEQERADEAFRLASSFTVFWMATKRLDEAPHGSIGSLRCPVAMTPVADEPRSMPGIWRSGRVTTNARRHSRIGPSSSAVRRTIPRTQPWP
jgi:hypothetical protein